MSRESCIKVLQDVFERDTAYVGITLTHEALEAVIEYLKDVPSADVLHWIPCSERLPEDEQPILFSTTTGRVHQGRFHRDNSVNRWYSSLDKMRAYNNVVNAWMPLPEPWKDGEQND